MICFNVFSIFLQVLPQPLFPIGPVMSDLSTTLINFAQRHRTSPTLPIWMKPLQGALMILIALQSRIAGEAPKLPLDFVRNNLD